LAKYVQVFLYKFSYCLPAQPVARRQHVARADIWKEKSSVNRWWVKTEEEHRRNLENLWDVYLWIHKIYY